MAGYPPPYPPNQPYGYDPKTQARMAREQLKAQVRAQKAAFRAQRDLYRYQTRSAIVGNRRSSILAPLLILSVGVIVLLMRLGRIPVSDFGDWYGRWWPILLVGAGVVLVAEWAFRPRSQLRRHTLRPPRRRWRSIFLLILLTLTGVTAHAIHNRNFFTNGWVFNPYGDDIGNSSGEKHEMSATADASFPAGSSLAITNPHGNVTITSANPADNLNPCHRRQTDLQLLRLRRQLQGEHPHPAHRAVRQRRQRHPPLASRRLRRSRHHRPRLRRDHRHRRSWRRRHLRHPRPRQRHRQPRRR